ncbi:MAG: FHA domain-containing protein [Gammaproteobacteria bacterium]|nr:FHA domain-containing protein [Gammaproteobacteria bacterium]
MAALLESPGLLPADTGSRPEAAAITAALAYVGRCIRGHRPFAIVTGSRESGVHSLAEKIWADYRPREDLHVVRISEPTDSVQEFLTVCLGQLGFELIEAVLDDLHNLLVVFLRHESSRGRRTLVIIENAERSGPRILDFLQTLTRIRAGATPALSIVLTGSRSVHRVLDSPGMASMKAMTRERFDLDRAFAWVSPAPARQAGSRPGSSAPDAAPSLVVMLDSARVGQHVLEPGRLLIGRSPRSGLCLNSRYVSRTHAAVVVSGHQVSIIDLGSTNGTLVDEEAVNSRVLADGNIIAIGNFRLRYTRQTRPADQSKG